MEDDNTESSYGVDNFIKNTEEYERAMLALKTPRGERLEDIANSEYNEVSVDVLRRVTLELVQRGQILIESDGQRTNPRLYTNTAMGFMQGSWEIFAHFEDRESLDKEVSNIQSEIESYKERTGFEDPMSLEQAISAGEFSHIRTDGEVYWELCVPWIRCEQRIRKINFVKDNYDIFEILENSMDIKVEGAHGDFTNVNALRAKLGLDDEMPTNETIDEKGNIHEPEE
jgi:hypothetical protein